MTFGERIAARRKALNLTQEDVAKKLGCTSAAISQWECNGAQPHIATLIALARALKTSASDLLGESKTA